MSGDHSSTSRCTRMSYTYLIHYRNFKENKKFYILHLKEYQCSTMR